MEKINKKRWTLTGFRLGTFSITESIIQELTSMYGSCVKYHCLFFT